MPRWTFILLLPTTMLFACTAGDKGGGGQDSGGADGSDGTDGTIDYEDGCILVDGEGGYAWINDAIAVAEQGSTIELCASTGHEEEVLLDKGVHIVGPGIEDFVLIAPTNSAGVTITGAGASISGMTIQTSRSAVRVEGANGVEIDTISVLAAGNWGIQANDSNDLEISNVTLLGNGVDGINYGGINVEGGSATVSTSTIQGNIGYGVWADDGADVSVIGCDIDSTAEFDSADDTTDGVAVYATEGASAFTSGNTFIGNALAAGWADGGDLSMDGDTIYGGAVGAFVIDGAATYANLVVEDVLSVGLLASTTEPVRISNVTVTTTPEGSAHVEFESYPSASIAGTGMLVAATDIEISDVAISGFNNAGLYLEARDTGATAQVDDIAVSNNGNYGVFANGGIVATFNNLTIDSTRVVDALPDRMMDLDGDGVDDVDPLCYYVNYFAAFYNSASTVTWNGGGMWGSEGWGVSNLQGSLNATGVEFEGATCAGTVSLQSVLSVSGSTFSQRGEAAHIISQDDSAVVLDSNTFTDNQAIGEYTQVQDYVDLYGYRLTYVYADGYAAANDAVIYGASSLEITNNTFEDGDLGLALAGVDGRVEDNTWTNYRSTALQVGSYSTADGSVNRGDLVVDGANFDGINGRMLYCSSANLELEDVVIENGGPYAYSYETLYEYDSDGDGELDAESTWSGSGTTPNIGIYAYGCDLLMSDVTVQDSEGNGIELYASSSDSSVDAIGLTIQRTGTDTVYSEGGLRVYANQAHISLNLSEVLIDDVESLQGINLYATSTGSIDFSADEVTIQNVGSDGIYMVGSGASADLSEVVIDTVAGDGIIVDGGALVLDGTSITNAAGNGIMALGDFDNDGFSVADGDCNDTSSSISPARTESMGNLYDDNCDGVTDDGTDTTDADGDGYSVADGDCNDDSSTGAAINPGATEVDGNGIDDDCSGDADGGLNALLSVTNLTITGSGDAGVYAQDRTLDFDGNTVTGSGTWGLECDSTAFTSCDGNVLSGNTSGATSGCDLSCTP